MKRGKSRRGRFRRGDVPVAGGDGTLRRLRAACLACRLLALAACAAGLALAVQMQAHAANPAGDAAPGLTLALLGAIVAGLAGRQR
jgi:hypothetical protein